METFLYKVFFISCKKKVFKKLLLLDIDILWKLIRTLWFNPLECQKDWKIGVAFCSHVVGYKHLVDYCSFAFNHLPKNRGSSHFMPILWKIYILLLLQFVHFVWKDRLIFFVKILWKKLQTTPWCLKWFIFTYKWFWNGKFQTLQHKNSQVQNFASFKSYLSYKVS